MHGRIAKRRAAIATHSSSDYPSPWRAAVHAATVEGHSSLERAYTSAAAWMLLKRETMSITTELAAAKRMRCFLGTAPATAFWMTSKVHYLVASCDMSIPEKI